MKLVIVESPTKARTIEQLLGAAFQVRATQGHIKDLPTKELGITPEKKYQPTFRYIKGKKKIADQIAQLARDAEKVFIATDPDREGELIAWHLHERLKKNGVQVHRISFHEITEQAILQSLSAPRELNLDLVHAQQARRVLDRLVGYKISPFLWNRIKNQDGGLSAGRVQSATLKLVAEKEMRIADFSAQSYWNLLGNFQTKNLEVIQAHLDTIDGRKVGSPTSDKSRIILTSENKAIELLTKTQKESYFIHALTTKNRTQKPPAPFITATLQQEASKKFGFSSKRTIQLAQALYEGIPLGKILGSKGLITYMRTDSPRISDSASQQLRTIVVNDYGTKYVPKRIPSYRIRKGSNAQESHEAIRPTDFSLPPKSIRRYLTTDQFNLYQLIWDRTLASQMSPAMFQETTVKIASKSLKFIFKASKNKALFRGFTIRYQEETESEIESIHEGLSSIPDSLVEKQPLTISKLAYQKNETKPPSRYSEASLIEELEKYGIGRPSTYSSIIATIQERNYVYEKQKAFFASSKGLQVNQVLSDSFPELFTLKFTSQMEAALDAIASGKTTYFETVQSFYENRLLPALSQKSQKGTKRPQPLQTKTCYQCGKLFQPSGINNRCESCAKLNSEKPAIKSTQTMEKPQALPTLHRDIRNLASKKICSKCGKDMVLRQSKEISFWGCSGFPKCRNTEKYHPIPADAVACPSCKNGFLIARTTKNGKIFYGCSTFPNCRKALWHQPINLPCPACSATFLIALTDQDEGITYQCPKCNRKTRLE